MIAVHRGEDFAAGFGGHSDDGHAHRARVFLRREERCPGFPEALLEAAGQVERAGDGAS